MKNNEQEPKFGHYYLHEFLPYIYCFACLVIALEYLKQAKSIYEEIKRLTRKMKGYEGQEKRLMSVLRLDVVSSDIVLDELNKMKKEREADSARLTSLKQTKENISKIEDSEAKLKELWSRIVPDLDYCTNQDKKDAYTYLDLKVTATGEGVDIKGYLDLSLLTIGQTSA